MFSPEFSFLVLACGGGDAEMVVAGAGSLLRGGKVGWEKLYALADLLSVRPQAAKLVAVLPSELIPDWFRARVNKAYLDIVHDQVSYAAEFLKVHGMLAAEGIPAVPFKGFWLAHEYYGSLGDREAGDVDLFTEFRHLERIREIMLANGYSVEPQMAGYTLTELAGRAGEYNFDKTVEGRCVSHLEFHWRMSSPVYGLGISFEELSSQVVEGWFQGSSLRVLTPSAAFLLTVMHHGGKDPFNELKYVLDFASILKRHGEIDWEWVLVMARRYRMVKLVYVAVSMAHELFGAPVPEAVADGCARPCVRRLTRNRIRFMAHALDYWHPWIFINDWLFRIRSRSGLRIKWQLTTYLSGILMKRLLGSKGGAKSLV